MDLQPLGDRLIVEALEEEEITSSGIVLPDTAKEKPQRGRVMAKYGGTDIKLGADEYLILRESDVLAKVVTTGRKSSKKKELAGAAA